MRSTDCLRNTYLAVMMEFNDRKKELFGMYTCFYVKSDRRYLWVLTTLDKSLRFVWPCVKLRKVIAMDGGELEWEIRDGKLFVTDYDGAEIEIGEWNEE